MGSRDDNAQPGDLRPFHSLEAEQSLLGALLANNEAFESLAGLITPDHCYSFDHRTIFRAIWDLIEDNKPADVITVAERLRSLGTLDKVGGFAYLHEIANATPSSSRIRHYSEIVREHFLRRRLFATFTSLADQLYRNDGQDGAAILEDAHRQILAIGETSSGQRGGLNPLNEALSELMLQLDEAQRQVKAGGIFGTPTGFSDLDEWIGGMKAGHLIVVAGRPGMGKTAFAVNVAEHVALVSKKAVPVFSMEMGQAEVALRLMASQSRVHAIRLSHGRISPGEWDDLAKGLKRLHDAPIFLCEDGGLTLAELTAGVRRFRRQHTEIGVVVVDYFGLMQVERPSSNHAQDLAQISSGLKALAKEIKAPIMLLAQLNREVEKRPNKRPVLSDLRDSGGLEQDADTVLMIYRDEVYRGEASDAKGQAEILIRKQRNGPTHTVTLTYDAARTRFRNYEGPTG